eukprot:CAMPEP_0183499454 /NCGR_PEP_ID=MMETSP0371-20130417/1688_1 /TAXON_ID=268820 /ORGANISM="Peridinium aciculiferum, Strain PAER-2" /LENGTH=108 /DNA_ID=CAMNT_0025693265 /DNA_START=29 /DNA_END=355 /DNA_ORIENTATION=+
MARESTATEAAMPPLSAELTIVLPKTRSLPEASFKVRSKETQPSAGPQYMRHVAEVGSILPPVESRRAWYVHLPSPSRSRVAVVFGLLSSRTHNERALAPAPSQSASW